LSLPRWARFLLARDPMPITRSLDIALRTIFAHQYRRARRAGALAPRTGAIIFVQRFGGAVSLNVHFHCIITDKEVKDMTLKEKANDLFTSKTKDSSRRKDDEPEPPVGLP
jgi:hypothetical protein